MSEPVKISVRLQIDADVLEWFKAQGEDWEERINAVLRSYYESQKQPRQHSIQKRGN